MDKWLATRRFRHCNWKINGKTKRIFYIIYWAIFILAPGYGTANETDFSSLAKQITQFKSTIAEFESGHGGFSYLLTEPLTQLAITQIKANRLDDADVSLDRAIQITRVSHGLYTPKQYDLLQMAVQNNSQRGDWDAANQGLDHIAWLITERYQGDAAHLLDRIMWLSDTHVAAAFNDDIDKRASHLKLATQYNKVAVQTSQISGDSESLAYAEVLYSLAQKYFIEAKAIQNGGSTSYYLRVPDLTKTRVIERQQALALRYRLGFETLQLMAQVLSGPGFADSEAQPLAALYMADWKLLFNQSKNTANDYAVIYQDLLQAGVQADQLDALFNAPVLIPRPELKIDIESAIADISTKGYNYPLPQPVSPTLSSDSRLLAHIQCTELSYPYFGLVQEILPQSLPKRLFEEKGLLRVALTIDPQQNFRGWINGQHVSRLGVAAELNIMTQVASDDARTDRVMRRLAALQFRPALLEGLPVAKQLILDYRFHDNGQQSTTEFKISALDSSSPMAGEDLLALAPNL